MFDSTWSVPRVLIVLEVPSIYPCWPVLNRKSLTGFTRKLTAYAVGNCHVQALTVKVAARSRSSCRSVAPKLAASFASDLSAAFAVGVPSSESGA